MAAKTKNANRPHKGLADLIWASESELEAIRQWFFQLEDARLATLEALIEYGATEEGGFDAALKIAAWERVWQRAVELTSVPNQQPHRDRLHADVLYWLDPALLRLRDAAESLAVADSEATRDAAIDKLNNACDGWRFQGKNFGQLFGLAIVARQREARKAKAKTLVAAEYLGEGRIRMDGQTKLLTAKAQIDFVERVLEGNGVASTSELTKAGVSNPSQTATELETLANGWLAAIVDRPAKKGQGYKLRLSDSRNLAKH